MKYHLFANSVFIGGSLLVFLEAWHIIIVCFQIWQILIVAVELTIITTHALHLLHHGLHVHAFHAWHASHATWHTAHATHAAWHTTTAAATHHIAKVHAPSTEVSWSLCVLLLLILILPLVEVCLDKFVVLGWSLGEAIPPLLLVLHQEELDLATGVIPLATLSFEAIEQLNVDCIIACRENDFASFEVNVDLLILKIDLLHCEVHQVVALGPYTLWIFAHGLELRTPMNPH